MVYLVGEIRIMSKNIKIILTGGGTAGHIWPTLAVQKAIEKKHKTEFLYIGSKNGLEAKIVPEQSIFYKSISVGKLRRYFSWNNFIDPFRAMQGFFQASKIIKRFKPDIIFAKGGYVTAPVVLAAWIQSVPIILHESDSVMGMANKFLSKYATKIAVTFPLQYYPKTIRNKAVYTGLPIRKEFLQDARCKIQDTNRRKTVLITGGSQGAGAINHLIFSILPKLTEKYKVIHLTGEADFQRSQKLKNQLSKLQQTNYQNHSFVTKEMVGFLKSADLVVSRSGGAVFELAAMKKPAILIPLPSAASDHQNKNAEIFAQNHASLVLKESELTPNKLLANINDLITKPVLLKRFSDNIYKMSMPNAADKIAELILRQVK